MALFKDRTDAGQQLVSQLQNYANRTDVLVLGLARGGMPVAFQVARALNLPLDVWLVRKLGLPGHEELAMGAIASGGRRVLNREIIDPLNIDDDLLERVTEEQRQELERREQIYRAGRPPVEAGGRTVILVDDGLATGASMHAAVNSLRTHQPAQIIVAAPIASPETCASFEDEVEEIICVHTPEPFKGVGAWYESFAQVSDDDVRAIIKQAVAELPTLPGNSR